MNEDTRKKPEKRENYKEKISRKLTQLSALVTSSLISNYPIVT